MDGMGTIRDLAPLVVQPRRGVPVRITASAISLNGVSITTPIETEPWGERFFQVTDPNGVTIQLVQWIAEPGDQA